ncbi:MAG: DUF1127 domain-containing protein [Aestuariivita sp.]|nr:DUF1127 domain-containing protein [Aestuariivita sp.]MCY4202393.1 DUF1127 domain-containing protein [Aestuariivita sp.]MCY4288668.1 DUF1127 domain-containing protein [Aestuariivita sp.]MCY4345561.1 DUF1127 domain-containing protein [Aestuariivita sp.]
MTLETKVLNPQYLIEESADRGWRWLNAQRLRYQRWRLFKMTQAELERLSDRELADLGLNRAEIKRVVRQATASWHSASNNE